MLHDKRVMVYQYRSYLTILLARLRMPNEPLPSPSSGSSRPPNCGRAPGPQLGPRGIPRTAVPQSWDCHTPASPAPAPQAKRPKTAGNKVELESLWVIERPWVFWAEEDGVEVLMCKLCTTHKPVGVGQRCWVDYGS